MNHKSIAISTFTGVLLACAWWLFFDSIITSADSFSWTHMLPPFLSTVAFVAINMVSPNRIGESGGIKMWLFLWITVAMVSVGISIWITTVEYPANSDYNWPGVALILSSMLLFFSALLLFIGRKTQDL